MSDDAEIIKADVLALPKLATTLGPTVMTDQAWVDLLAFVNTFNLGQIDTVATVRLARIYLAAHLALTCKQAFTGAAGPLTSESVGQNRRSFGLLAQGVGANNFNGTMYGQMFLTLTSMSAAHGPLLC